MGLTDQQMAIVEDAIRDQEAMRQARQAAIEAFLAGMRPTIKSQMQHWIWPRGATPRAAARVVHDNMKGVLERIEFDLSDLVLDVLNEIEEERDGGAVSVD